LVARPPGVAELMLITDTLMAGHPVIVFTGKGLEPPPGYNFLKV